MQLATSKVTQERVSKIWCLLELLIQSLDYLMFSYIVKEMLWANAAILKAEIHGTYQSIKNV